MERSDVVAVHPVAQSLKGDKAMAHTIQETVPAAEPDASVESARFRRAKERVEAVRGFYIHLGTYLIINLGIFLVNWVTVAANVWQTWFFYWVLLGWGVAVLINGFVVFGTDRFLGPEWEERKIREYLAKQK